LGFTTIPALPARAPGLHRLDHFPILAELSFQPAGAHVHEARPPMPGDRATPRRMIAKATPR
jgi:hypothetical protein